MRAPRGVSAVREAAGAKQQAAQRAGEQELGQEIADTRQDLNQAAQKAEQTSNNQQTNTEQVAEAAQNFAEQIAEAAQEFGQQAQEAQQAQQMQMAEKLGPAGIKAMSEEAKLQQPEAREEQ